MAAFTTGLGFYIFTPWYCTQFSINTAHTAFLFKNVALCINICAPFRLCYPRVVGVGARNREQSPKVPQICIIRFEATCYQAFQVSQCWWFVLQNSPRGAVCPAVSHGCGVSILSVNSETLHYFTPYMSLTCKDFGQDPLTWPHPEVPCTRSELPWHWCFSSLLTHLAGVIGCLQVKSSHMSPGHDLEHSRVPSQIQVSEELYNHPILLLT